MPRAISAVSSTCCCCCYIVCFFFSGGGSTVPRQQITWSYPREHPLSVHHHHQHYHLHLNHHHLHLFDQNLLKQKTSRNSTFYLVCPDRITSVLLRFYYFTYFKVNFTATTCSHQLLISSNFLFFTYEIRIWWWCGCCCCGQTSNMCWSFVKMYFGLFYIA